MRLKVDQFREVSAKKIQVSKSTIKSMIKFPFRSGTLEKTNSGSNLAILTRFLWIRIALFEKRLQKIVCYFVKESDRSE